MVLMKNAKKSAQFQETNLTREIFYNGIIMLSSLGDAIERFSIVNAL